MTRLALLLVLTTTAFAASLDPALIPHDRQWVAHLDVQKLLAGRIGAYLKEKAREPEAELKLRQLTFITGVDIARDVASLTIAGIDDDPAKVMVWIKGSFDADRLGQLVTLADQHRSETYQSHTIHTWVNKDDGNKPQAGCLVSGDLVLFAERPTAIRTALDVLDGRSRPIGEGDALRKALPALDSPFLVAAAAGGDGWKGKGARSQFVQQLASLGLSASEAGDRLVLNATAIATDAATATKLRDMAQGLIAIASFSEEVQAQPLLSQALQSVQINAANTAIMASVSCDLDTLEAAAEAHQGK